MVVFSVVDAEGLKDRGEQVARFDFAFGDPVASSEDTSDVQGMTEDELAELLARPAVNGNGVAEVGPTRRLL